MVFGSGRLFVERLEFILYFEGSVKGLNVGAPVVFRGVKIGNVTDISIQASAEDLSIKIPVLIETDTRKVDEVGTADETEGETLKKLINRGLRAKLMLQSMVTGQMMVGLDYYPETMAVYHGDGDILEIPTIQTDFEQLAETLKNFSFEKLFEKLEATLAGIERLVNGPEAQELVANLNHTISDVRQLVNDADRELLALSQLTGKTINDYGSLARNLNGQVEPLADRLDGALEDTQQLMTNTDRSIQALSADIAVAVERASDAMLEARKTLANTEALTAADSEVMYELTTALGEIGAAARAIRMLADYLERHPEALVQGKRMPGRR
jgi:paraquat-inducible protein B